MAGSDSAPRPNLSTLANPHLVPLAASDGEGFGERWSAGPNTGNPSHPKRQRAGALLWGGCQASAARFIVFSLHIRTEGGPGRTLEVLRWPPSGSSCSIDYLTHFLCLLKALRLFQGGEAQARAKRERKTFCLRCMKRPGASATNSYPVFGPVLLFRCCKAGKRARPISKSGPQAQCAHGRAPFPQISLRSWLSLRCRPWPGPQPWLICQPSCSGVTRPVCQRHRSTPNCRATATTAILRRRLFRSCLTPPSRRRW